MRRHVDSEALQKMVKCAVQDYSYKGSIPGHPYLPEKYWLSEEEGRTSPLTLLWPDSMTPMTLNLNLTCILTSMLIVYVLFPSMTWASLNTPNPVWLPPTWPDPDPGGDAGPTFWELLVCAKELEEARGLSLERWWKYWPSPNKPFQVYSKCHLPPSS